MAIIKLDKQLDFDIHGFVQPICLPTETQKILPECLEGHSVTIQGYGLGKLYKGIYDCSNDIT